jgi:tetratricopeptide (TPR) repeat protein
VALEKTGGARITLYRAARLPKRSGNSRHDTRTDPLPRMTGILIKIAAYAENSTRMKPISRRTRILLCTALLVTTTAPAMSGAEPNDARSHLLGGDYASAIRIAASGVRNSPNNVEWPILLVQGLLAVGRNAEADEAMRAALERDHQSIRLRWAAREVAFANGRPEEAAARVEEIVRLVRSRTWSYRAPADLVVFGRAALLLGADPKDVLEKIYAPATRGDPKLRDVYLARGELALEKHDFALAARAYEEGLEHLPRDPDLHAGRARAYAGGDREVALVALQTALDLNSRHIPATLQLANHHIDAEAYDEAEKLLDRIIAINSVQPDAWAYRAVIAHLRNDTISEQTARSRALSSWAGNPRVDHLIGTKLSQKYRFAEGAAYQRRARVFDPAFLPAKAQLAQDLLRLGNDAEGWALAHAVHEADEYDVEAYNLVTLHDTMKNYSSLTNEDFVVRMSSQEVVIYGPRVMALLRRAKEVLVDKYGVELARPTYVEIFADQKDFAVRTFGLPDVAGFLGVCFGRVVTANSPATSSSPTNWESVLWHEFCHVVTLQMTRNKMPRWLSEGISVHEERQANPSWGMRLNARYRQMILDGELVPVGKLSGAFLAPKSAEHLQFAYLQSSMVVDFIADRFGHAALRAVLNDLRHGAEINTALAQHTIPLDQLEKDFEAYALEQARQLAPQLDWEKPGPAILMGGADIGLAAWEKERPDNFWALRLRAQRAAEEKNWAEARPALERLIELYPGQKGPETPYRTLVAALKALGDTAAEREVLRRWTEVDDEAPDAYLRLMELAAADADWPTVARNADRYLAVNPLVAPPYRFQARASAAIGDISAAVVAWRTLLELDVPDATDAHFELARLLHSRGEHAEARRQVLLALEETPRYREALRLLLEVNRSERSLPVFTPDSVQPTSPDVHR